MIMKTAIYLKLALLGLLLSGLITSVAAQTTQETYLGKIKYQDQTISKASAAKLNREIDLQRASQLTLWAMPITSFYQIHKAAKANLGYGDDEVVIGTFEGYNAVYPFVTANVTTPYTSSNIDLSATGPLVVNIPAGGIFGVANNAWQEPIKEIGS